MNTEKERIEVEELVYTDDYLRYIDKLVDYSTKTHSREFDSLMRELTVALHEKVTYILDESSKYRHELGFWARLREKRRARKITKELLLQHQEQQNAVEEQPEAVKKDDAVLTPNFKALSEFSQNSVLLETKDSVKMIENLKNTNAQDEGQCMSF